MNAVQLSRRNEGILFYVILATLALTPLWGITELLSNFGLELGPFGSRLQIIKLGKDACFALIMFWSLGRLFKNGLSMPAMWVFLAIFVLMGIGLANVAVKDIRYIIGFRTMLPFFAFFYGSEMLDEIKFEKIVRVTNVVFILLFISIVYEYFFLHTWGTSSIGLNKRACGFLFYPSPAAGFTAFVYWINSIGKRQSKLVRYIPLMSVVSILMISSAMGYLLFLVVIVLKYFKKKEYLVLGALLVMFSVAFLLFIYPVISGRQNFSTSTNDRVTLLIQSILEGGLIGVAPGHGSNLFIRQFGAELGSPEMVDSLYATLNWQYGVFASLGIIAVALVNVLKHSLFTIRNKEYFVDTLVIILVMGASIALTEFFPMNLLLPILTGYFSVRRIGEAETRPIGIKDGA